MKIMKNLYNLINDGRSGVIYNHILCDCVILN